MGRAGGIAVWGFGMRLPWREGGIKAVWGFLEDIAEVCDGGSDGVGWIVV